jgi:molybdopterin-guanine dinucleotide biosynthesis protein A
MIEPLHAVYSKNCLTTIKNLLEQGKMRFTDLLTLVKVRYVEAEEINLFDPKHLSFFNINTEADLKTAQELVKEGDITSVKR